PRHVRHASGNREAGRGAMTIQPKIPKLSKPTRQPWEVGDRVCFAHMQNGPVHTVTAICFVVGQPMVEVSGMSGQFAAHLFILAEPSVTRSQVDEFSRRASGAGAAQ